MRRTFAQVWLSVNNLDIVHLRANIRDKHNSDCAMGGVSFSEYVYADQYR